jgi:hypothetical protein
VSGYFANWRAENDAARVWKGGYRRYDLVKEVVIATGVVLAMAVLLTVLFSSPDEKPSTIASWSRQMPADFVTTATSELDGSSFSASYGPPYNNGTGAVQHEWFIHLQQWLGISHPLNAPLDFVIDPLRSIPGQPGLRSAIAAYEAATPKMQSTWTTNYANAVAPPAGSKIPPAKVSGLRVIPVGGDYGPVALMMSSLLSLAQSGGLDGALLTTSQFYQTDYTKPLLLMADGGDLSARAQAENLLGDQWGMMNETGSYPGQVWLWLYTFWYQIAPFNSSANADLLVLTVMGVMSLAFILIPFLPIARDIPRWIPLHRVIWSEHYRSHES